MKRMNALAGAPLLAVGLAACGPGTPDASQTSQTSSVAEVPQSSAITSQSSSSAPSSEAVTPSPSTTSEAPAITVSPKAQALAAALIKITQIYPNTTGGKPPRSFSATVNYPKGGQLNVAVQTASNGAPDARQPQEMNLTQAVANSNYFSADFLVQPDGSLVLNCTDHTGITTTVREMAELVQEGTAAPSSNPDAPRMIDNALDSALVAAQKAADGDPSLVGDMCHVLDY